MIQLIILFLGIFMFNLSNVNAQNYSNTTNMFDGSTSQQLINIGMSRVDDFLDYNFIIFQNDTTYYMILFKDYYFNNNLLQATNTIVFRYFREGSNYDYKYTYDMYNDSYVNFTTSYIFVSNLNISKSSGSPIHQKLLDDYHIKWLIVLLVAFTFASFLLKERSYY